MATQAAKGAARWPQHQAKRSTPDKGLASKGQASLRWVTLSAEKVQPHDCFRTYIALVKRLQPRSNFIGAQKVSAQHAHLYTRHHPQTYQRYEG